jgi:hypothetical protein
METKSKNKPNICKKLVKISKISLMLKLLNSSSVNCVLRVLSPTETFSTGFEVRALDFADVNNSSGKFLYSTDQGLYGLNYDETLPLGNIRMSSSMPTFQNFDGTFDKTKINHVHFVRIS